MRTMVLLVLGLGAVGLLTAANKPGEGKAANGLKALEGTWTVVSLTRDGKDLPAETLPDLKVVFEDGKYTMIAGGKAMEEGTVMVDPSTKPAQIETTPTTGNNKG